MSSEFGTFIREISNSLKNEKKGAEQERHESEKHEPSLIKKRPSIRYSSADVQSSYANCFSLTAKQEEVILTYGIHQNWERPTEIPQLDMSDCIILNPYMAKRLSMLLQKIIQAYESKYGDNNMEIIGKVSQEAKKAVKH